MHDKDPWATYRHRAALQTFIREQGGRVGKREIARHFDIAREDKPALRDLLKTLGREGAIAPAGHKRFTEPGRLPETSIIQIFGTDPDGDPLGRPIGWQGNGAPPLVLMHPEPRRSARARPWRTGARPPQADRERQIRGDARSSA